MLGKLKASEWFITEPKTKVERDIARDMVKTLHYSGTCPPAFTHVYCLFRHDAPERLMGVAWWKAPMPNAAKSVARHCGTDPKLVSDLSRLAIHPDAPTNAASFLIGRSIRHFRQEKKYQALVSWADAFEGHTGQIYKATNWEYLGQEKRQRRVWVDAEGRRVSTAQGHKKNLTIKQMEELGARVAGWSSKHKFVICLKRRS